MKYLGYLGLALIVGLSFGACTTADSGTGSGTDVGDTSAEATDTGGEAGDVTDDTTAEDECAGTVDECGVCQESILSKRVVDTLLGFQGP